MSRLKNLSDGVFAIALTLLVLDLRLPDTVVEGNLSTGLLNLAPKVLVYILSFVIIGGAWGSHQRMLAQISRGDGLLAWLNLFSLLSVSIVPASAALLGRFPGAFIPLTCFAINVVLIQLTAQWLWQHAHRHGLTNPALDERVIESISRRLNLSAIVFGLSIPVAIISPTLVYLIWIGMFVLLFTTDWYSWQQAFRSEQASIPLDDARSAHVRVQHWGGQLTIGGHNTMANLVQGTFGGGLNQQVNYSGEEIDVQLRSEGHSHSFMNVKFPWTWGPANLLDWALTLRQQFPITLEVDLASGQGNLTLGELQISELNLTLYASSMMVSLPAHAGRTSVKIQASRVSLTLHVPPEVGVDIQMGNPFTPPEIDLNRFPMTGQAGEYRSPNYDTAADRVDININFAGGTVKVI
jgi:uncharacterized membrane protein